MTPPTELAPGRLFALSNAYAVDGRVSWHPPGARGVAPMSIYVFREGREDLLIDTGLTVHRQAILDGLADLGVGSEGRHVSLMTLRSGEFDSIGNLAPIARSIPLHRIYSFHPDGIFWGDMHPDLPFDPAHDLLVDPEFLNVGGAQQIQMGSDGERAIAVLKPELRLLYTNWLYDEATKTLLTSDAFAWVIRPEGAGDAGPWTITSDEDRTTIDDVRAHLLETRFWWIAGADLFDVRSQLAEIFETLDIERVAPSFGCILEGRDLVQEHYRMLDAVLAEQGRSTPLRPGNVRRYT